MPNETRRKPRRIAKPFAEGVVRLCVIRVKPETAKALTEEANRQEVSESWLRREALETYLENAKGETV